MPTEIVFVLSDSTWEIKQKGYPDGSWAGFTDEQVCRNFARWLDENFDTDGIIARLHGQGNTPEDLANIAIIKRRQKHVTYIHNPEETIAAKFHRERGTPDWE